MSMQLVLVRGAAQSGSLVLLADDFQDGDAEGGTSTTAGTSFGSGDGDAAWPPPGRRGCGGRRARSGIPAMSCGPRSGSTQGGLAVATAVGPEGRYVVHLHDDGTDLLIDRPWGTFETLATAAPVTPGEWHALAIGVQDDLVHVYVDGEPLAAVAVDRPLVAGSVGFGALDGSIVAFDNVYVTVLRGPLPSACAVGPAGPVAVEAPEVEEPPDEGGGDEPEGEAEGVSRT